MDATHVARGNLATLRALSAPTLPARRVRMGGSKTLKAARPAHLAP